MAWKEPVKVRQRLEYPPFGLHDALWTNKVKWGCGMVERDRFSSGTTRATETPASGRLFIGCAGWSISTAAGAAVPGEGSHLERYARVLTSVEINSSFYRPHRLQTYERWADTVPPAFRFSVKLPRAITHEARLSGIDAALERFALEVAGLGPKLGYILVQLPPSLMFDPVVAHDFFNALSARIHCGLACEARHPSWFAQEATALLQAHAVIRVIADPAVGQPGPHVPTTPTLYLRLHGAPRRYYSSYADDYLLQLGRDMRVHAAAGRDVWCIFDNTASGAALPNALQALRPDGVDDETCSAERM